MRLTPLITWAAITGALLPLASAQPASADRLERIKASQTVQVCIWPDYYGISLANSGTVSTRAN